MYQDKVFVNARFAKGLSWADRIRVLFGAGLSIHVEVETENLVGACRSETKLNVDVLFPRKSQGQAEMAVGQQEA